MALVADDAATRERLGGVIEATAALQLVFIATGAAEAISLLGEAHPDVLLVDLGLPGSSGLDMIRACRARSPTTEVIMITTAGREDDMIRGFEAGARGYLLKDGTPEDLARHVTDLQAGGAPMSASIARRLASRMAQPAGSGPQDTSRTALVGQLSPREREILSLLARGLTYEEVATSLGLPVGTVQTHVKSIYSKLAVQAGMDAAVEGR